MRYFVVAMGEDDFVKAGAQRQAEQFVSTALTWDSPVTVVEVPWPSLQHGLEPYEKARLGRSSGR